MGPEMWGRITEGAFRKFKLGGEGERERQKLLAKRVLPVDLMLMRLRKSDGSDMEEIVSNR